MQLRSYALVTASYWAFTLTDGALRMLVLLHFHALGFSALHIAFLFLLYEFCGILTNLLGGWAGSKVGLKSTLLSGLFLQVLALVLLAQVASDWSPLHSVIYVMVVQALSGVAKDLTKMSSKSAVKLLVQPASKGINAQSGRNLFRWVAILTGSKNTLKGFGFFLGGALLSLLGFEEALLGMACALLCILVVTAFRLKEDMGRTKKKVKFKQLFSKSREINFLSFARLFLFGSRDVWFVVGLPIFLAETFDWSHSMVGGFLAAWIIGYGLVQAAAPKLIRAKGSALDGAGLIRLWGAALMVLTLTLAALVQFGVYAGAVVTIGLLVFGVVFAVNSSIHSFLILAYSDDDHVALNVGFYYMANAGGRLLGTLLSGLVYSQANLVGCLWMSALMLLVAYVATLGLPTRVSAPANPTT